MTKTIHKLESLLLTLNDYTSTASHTELSHKNNPDKWSKKEILGHLIDSGINNLQRFTEIQFVSRPFKITPYHQMELVKANNYQDTETKDIIALILAINNQIINVMSHQTNESLKYEVELPEGKIVDLSYLMKDYVDHFEHHTKQIV